MIDKNTLQELAESLSKQIPLELQDLKAGAEQRLQSLLLQQIEKLDLVSREEFEVQNTILLRTTEKLSTLEKALEKLLKA